MKYFVIFFLTLWANQSFGKTITEFLHSQKPPSETVRALIAFWEKIFYHYPSHSAIIHDSAANQNIVDIVDFKVWARKQNISDEIPNLKKRNAITSAYLRRYELGLKRFQRFGKKAMNYGAIEQRLFHVFSRKSTDINRLFAGNIELRLQIGLADQFIPAASRAKKYLPYMQEVFERQGIPSVLTRVAFVESMFRHNAVSKVGASGIWQIMPKTAKPYLRVDHLIDERNSPYKAAVVAARLLAMNFDRLNSWPLAITAYNHGASGLKKALHRLKTNDFNTLIESYSQDRFGFASRNFYAEFIAAAKTYERLIQEGKIAPPPAYSDVEKIVLPKTLKPQEILHLAAISEEQFVDYNHCLNKKIFSSYAGIKLPLNYSIFLPKSHANTLRNAFSKLLGSTYAQK